MLFLDPEARGQGLGARLLCLGMEQYGVSELTVNEQNPAAAGFSLNSMPCLDAAPMPAK